ncbi:hypothetical protein LEN26_014766 [Aphanomyces euteiches]|nr:hypothetical protein LEN26_014766 [Aphanomyces euteiches]KAH9112862.1 hypothetical protein AeMF1_012879 [Aphanomyces euteiches]KAH9183918.1 hypothetical protein AeNC1_014107 [Aphanomyces euteiches]
MSPPQLNSKICKGTSTVDERRAALELLKTMSDYKVAALAGRPRRTIRRWAKEAHKIRSFKGNVKPKKIGISGRKEEFPDPATLVAYMTKMRENERALTCTHVINWTKKHHREWLNNYMLNMTPGTAYNSLLRLLQRFCKRHRFTQQRLTKMKYKKEVLTSLHEEFSADFHREFQAIDDYGRYNADETGMYYEMPPRIIWSIRGGDAKISAGEKHA